MDLWTAESRLTAREVFGRPARVLLGAWVLEQGEAFFQGQALDALRPHGEAASAVLQELNRFVKLGMLQRVEPVPGERRVWYVPQPTPIWEIFRAAAQAFAPHPPAVLDPTDAGQR